MIPPGKRKWLPAQWMTAVVAALCVLLIVLIVIHPGNRRHAGAVAPFCILQPDSIVEEHIPDYAGVRRTCTYTLPEFDAVTTAGACLSAYLRHTFAQISIEGSALGFSVSEDDPPHIGHTPGNYWISIPMRPSCAGKTVLVTLTPVYAGVRDEMPTFRVIPRDALISRIELPKDALLLSLGLFAVISGLLLVLTSLILPLDAMDRQRVFHMGAVAMLAGLWKLCGLPVLTLLLDGWGIQKAMWYTGAVCCLMMLALSLRLTALLRPQTDNRLWPLCLCLSAGLAALLLILQIAGLAELYETLVWYGVGMAVLHGLSLIGQRPTRSELAWVCPFFLTLGVDLVIDRATGSTRPAPVFLIWLILHLFVRGCGFVKEALRRESLLRIKEKELRDIRVQSMTGQIRPHFIYNTLSAIYVLCQDDPKLAMQVIQDFSTYLQAKYTAISATDPIAFIDELEHTRAYIAVESLRYGDKLRVEYDLRHTDFRLPALTLQPLVENAVKHGLGKGIGPEHIRISTRAEEGRSVIVVTDDGPGIVPGDCDSGIHVGLQNVRQRLELMCGGTLHLESASGRGTAVTIVIPHVGQPTRGESLSQRGEVQ